MSNWKNIFSYFVTGFYLLNKNIKLYLILITLIIINSIISIRPSSVIGIPLLLVSIAISFIQWGFKFSIPIIMVHAQSGKKLDYVYLREITLETTKKLIAPIIVLYLFFALFIIFGIVFIVASTHGDVSQMKTTIQQLSDFNTIIMFRIFMLPRNFLYALLFFTPIFFTLEKDNFITAVKKSIIFSLNNLRFIILIFFALIIDLLLSFIPFMPLIELKWGLTLYQCFSGYIFLWLLTSCLLYYQNAKK